MNILNVFIKQIKAHPVTVVFFIIGYFISTLILSIGLSNIINMRNLIIEKNNGIYKNSLNVYISSSKGISFEDFTSTFKDISDKSKIRFNTTTTYINNSNTEYGIIAEYFKSNDNSNFPILKGRYYTTDEVKNNEKVVVIGKQLKQFTYESNNKQKIKLGSDEYVVIGIAGYENQESTWDKTIFMPITALPENSKLNYFRLKSSTFLLISEDNKEASDIQVLSDDMKKFDSETNIQVQRAEESQNVLLSVIGQNMQFLIIAGIVFVFSIINIINISSFWINERKSEMAIRKAFGVSNLQISALLFMEFMSITLVTTILSLLFQLGLNLVVKSISGYYISISVGNFIFAIFMSVVTALITVIIPSIKVLKISPIEALK